MDLSLIFTQKGIRVNERGNMIEFEVTTCGLTLKQWQKRLVGNGHKLIHFPAPTTEEIYNKNHRYEKGKTLKMFLVLGRNFGQKYLDEGVAMETITTVAEILGGNSAVKSLKAELAFLIREKFSNEMLETLGLWYIAVPHEPIVDDDLTQIIYAVASLGGDSRVISLSQGEKWIGLEAMAFIEE